MVISARTIANAMSAVRTPTMVTMSQPTKRSVATSRRPRADLRARMRARRTPSLMASCSQSMLVKLAYHTRRPLTCALMGSAAVRWMSLSSGASYAAIGRSAPKYIDVRPGKERMVGDASAELWPGKLCVSDDCRDGSARRAVKRERAGLCDGSVPYDAEGPLRRSDEPSPS
jgi:hypothetical protein